MKPTVDDLPELKTSVPVYGVLPVRLTNEERIAPARGVLMALVLCGIFWAAVVAFVLWVW